jgi:glutathione-regulated potassium-efflux system protein KefB
MSLDLGVVAANWQIIALSVVGYMAVKAVAIYGIARLLRSSHAEALERAALMAQGGEFAFVLYTTAASAGIIDGQTNAIFTATVIISMVLTPFTMMALKWVLPKPEQSMDGVEVADGLTGNVLVIGFGRFGQIATQALLAKRLRVAIIDTDTEMIRVAGQFGMKVYYGDGTRLDILRAAGAGTADAILVCIDNKDAATRTVELIKSEFPLVKVFSRAYDRGHALELVSAGVDFQMREMFESALAFGAETLKQLGSDEDEVAEIIDGVRERDRQRFSAQIVGGIRAGMDLLMSNAEDQARESGVVAAPSEPIIPVPEDEQAAKV